MLCCITCTDIWQGVRELWKGMPSDISRGRELHQGPARVTSKHARAASKHARVASRHARVTSRHARVTSKHVRATPAHADVCFAVRDFNTVWCRVRTWRGTITQFSASSRPQQCAPNCCRFHAAELSMQVLRLQIGVWRKQFDGTVTLPPQIDPGLIISTGVVFPFAVQSMWTT